MGQYILGGREDAVADLRPEAEVCDLTASGKKLLASIAGVEDRATRGSST
jgi:hypothetical protein